MDWGNLFTSFAGRIPRRSLWIGTIILLVVSFVVQSLIASTLDDSAARLLSLVVALLLAYPGFAILAKRCHDRGKSGWWSLLVLVPVVNIIWFVIDMGILKGTDGPNAHGPDPLSPGGGQRAAAS